MSDWLDDALEEARTMAQNHGNKRALYELAKDYVETVDAKLMLKAPDGTVDFKRAWVVNHAKHKDALVERKNRIREWFADKLEKEILFAQVHKYQTDAADKRWIHKAHT